MSASVSPFSCLSLIMPFEEFRVLCSETVTGKLKKVVVLRRFSVCDLRFVSTRSVLFFNFFLLILEYQ